MQIRPNSSDVPTFEKIFISREYDLSFLDLQPRTIVDLGANVGYASMYFASKFPKARIIAVEPEPNNFRILKSNTAGFSNIECVNAAIWPTPASMAVVNPEAASWAFIVGEVDPARSDGSSIRGMTVEELAREHDLSTIDVLKIDIEGAEKELFQPGCEKWLQKVGVLIAELHDNFRPGCGTAFYRATSKLDFNYFNVGENVVLVRTAT